ncbi:protein DCL, chloroplastic [Nymphaea colorata]|nr:protein DCL, chloroplastic [Nymphaea colorata]XP_031494650.1 protein DCL, chloroplastic [Nymphaea colorata]
MARFLNPITLVRAQHLTSLRYLLLSGGLCAKRSRVSTRAESVDEASRSSGVVVQGASHSDYTAEYKRWKEHEEEILNDIEPITLLAKDILHSDRYADGDFLTAQDEKEVVKNLLAYHPNADDKIGCGLSSIMVDRHPTFKQSRCLFVVRTDGGWIDFSYKKCLQAYIREKYPSCAEKFIKGYFKQR